MARIRNDSIQVLGLRDLERELRGMDKSVRRELTIMNKSVAAMVADDARSAALSLGSTPAHNAPSIKPTAGTGFAGVALGGPRFPSALGAEFGSSKYKQFRPWKGNGENAGYFLYPTIRQDEPQIVEKYDRGMDDFLRKNGFR